MSCSLLSVIWAAKARTWGSVAAIGSSQELTPPSIPASFLFMLRRGVLMPLLHPSSCSTAGSLGLQDSPWERKQTWRKPHSRSLPRPRAAGPALPAGRTSGQGAWARPHGAGSRSGLTSPRAGERAEGAVPSPSGATVPGSGGTGAAQSPGRGAPRSALRGPARTPGPSHRRAGAPPLRGEGGGIGTPSPPSPTRRVPHAPLPSQLCGRGLSPPTSALPCGRRVHLHIRVRAGASATPLAEM